MMHVTIPSSKFYFRDCDAHQLFVQADTGIEKSQFNDATNQLEKRSCFTNAVGITWSRTTQQHKTQQKTNK
jgi:hypothetical protein